jgi:mono/diheme cytochrome c family protein
VSGSGQRRLAALALVALPALAAWLAAPSPRGTAGAAEGGIDLGTDAQRQAGRVVYDRWCGQCHGDGGAGDGPAAPYLLPPPRDFTSGKYKFRSTPFGTLPTDEDLERAIRLGLPGTGMPGFPALGDDEVAAVIAHLKTLSADWQDPAAYGEPVAVPDPPAFDAERAADGFQAYVEIGCARCHGEEGRGDGSSAPTLRDDWGHFIRVADLTMPWTFRGGATRRDIYRTISTGINGTPMAGFGEGAITPEQGWQIVDWIVAQAGGEGAEAPYSRLVTAAPADGEVELPAAPAALGEVFAAAPPALFPVVGQIMQPGRAFQPAARAVEVRALFDDDDIAFLVSWHDMSAERAGDNRPDVPAPTAAERGPERPGARASLWNERGAGRGGAAAEGPAAGETLAPAPPPADDFWGAAAAPEAGAAPAAESAPAAGGDFWGEAEATEAGGPAAPTAGTGGDFWDAGGADVAAAPAAAVAASPWVDAVALQFPSELRPGVAKPYFLFGDADYPVELWHVALAAEPRVSLYEGRGSAALTRVDRPPPEVLAHYDKGRWSVAYKRPREPQGAVGFPEEGFVPIAVTVWDGFHHERGDLRGLTRWFHVYVPPLEAPSPVGPMLRTALVVLALELLVVFSVRRRHRRAPAATAAPSEA